MTQDEDDGAEEIFRDQIDRMEAMLEHHMVQIAYVGAMCDEIMMALEIDTKAHKKGKGELKKAKVNWKK
jgi:hypothetical protein